MKRLEGKVAVITGSTKGIGKAIAQKFLEEGACVVVSSRSQTNLDAALQALSSPNARGKVCDVSKYSDVEALLAFALKEFGKLDVWINNAGVAEPYRKIVDAPLEAWYEPIEINLKGTYHGCRAVLPYFLAQRRGKIINMAGAGSSEKKFDSTACISGYAASKAAIKRLTFSLAEEYQGLGIEIMLLNPGMVRTEILGTRNPTPEMQKRLERFLKVQDIFAQPPSVAAELAVKMASSWSDGKNGLFLSALDANRARQLLLTYPFRRAFGKIDRQEY
ncbi:MAG: SDR family oxidoreductase [Chloroherpetonaceae bacterium]|nr:SDR family oxidoreductase [Chloroherpetonaceae bacterium]